MSEEKKDWFPPSSSVLSDFWPGYFGSLKKRPEIFWDPNLGATRIRREDSRRHRLLQIWMIGSSQNGAEVEIPVVDLKNVFDVLDEDDDGASSVELRNKISQLLMLVENGSIFNVILDVPHLGCALRYHLHQRNGSTGCLGGGLSHGFANCWITKIQRGSVRSILVDLLIDMTCYQRRCTIDPQWRQVKDALYLSELLDKGQEPSKTQLFGRSPGLTRDWCTLIVWNEIKTCQDHHDHLFVLINKVFICQISKW